MVINTFDTSFRFPVSRKIRKSPRFALIVFTTSVVIVTTVLVNLFLFAKGCDFKSKQASFLLSVDPINHESVELPNANDDQALPDLGAAPLARPAVPNLVSGGFVAADTSAEFEIDKVKGRITFPKPISRSVIGKVVEHFKLKKGFEVGVRQGVFSKEMLRQWNTCQSYHLVDLWSNPEGGLGAKILQSTQEQNMLDAFENTSPWKEKISHCKNFSTVCATRVGDNSFDFGYIDARHDFKSVYEDIGAWFPKIRVGGVMAGHDYMSSLEVAVAEGINWRFNADRSKDYALQGVKGAVNLFFAAKGLFVAPCSPIPSFSSWVVYKGAPGEVEPNDLLHFIDFKCFEESKCDYVSPRMEYTVRAWETLNPGFLVLVWTAETLSWFFKEDVNKYRTVYKNDAKAFEDMMKLRVLHRFGGTYIHESIIPLQGLQKHVDQVKASAGGPAGFCTKVTGSETGEFTNKCKKASRLLISGKRGDGKILELANKHEKAFAQGVRSEGDSMKLSDEILKVDGWNVFKTETPFPCSSFTLSAGCVAQENYSDI